MPAWGALEHGDLFHYEADRSSARRDQAVMIFFTGVKVFPTLGIRSRRERVDAMAESARNGPLRAPSVDVTL
jgi:hypothetical protein